MRNTLKIRTRIIAGLLAAATTVSAFTAVGTTAFAEEAVCVEEAIVEEAGTAEAAACDQFIEEPAADAFAGQDTGVAAEAFAAVDVACDEAQGTFVDETGGQITEVEAVFDAPADAGYAEGAAVEEGVEVAVEAAEEVAGAPADEAAAEEALVGDPAEELAGDPAEALDPELNPELDPALEVLDPALDPTAELAGTDLPQEDKALGMTELINETVAANEEAGIYAALDSTFTVLAENAGELTDPANGIKKIDSETMITATYDALAANFDNSSEELYGAIGAAAARASDNGLIKAMKDDGALSALAKQEKKEINYWNASKKAYKSVFDGTVDLITVPFPAFKAFAPLMKLMMGTALEDGSQNNQMAELKEQLDEITAKLEDNRNRIEDHMYNVVAMSDIGNEMGSVKAKAETIRSRIANIERNSLTEEERTQQIADLYKNSEFMALESAVNGGTDCFFSSRNTIFRNRNIFDAAYATASETVMFSREALEVSAPYLIEQIAIYTAAYSVLSKVYDNYEKVYGANSLKDTREKQAARLFGMDLNGNRTGESVNELFANYMKRDKYIFVGESSSTNIPLRKRILVRANSNKDLIVNPKWYAKWCRTPDFMSSMPLSTSHVEKLAAYCARRKTTIFNFLLNEMRFEPTAYTDAELKKNVLALQPFDMDYAGFGFKYSPRGRMVTGNVLLVAGAQEISKNRPGGGKAWLTYKAVNAAKVGAQSSTTTFAKNRIEARGNMYPDESSNNTLLFFLAA